MTENQVLIRLRSLQDDTMQTRRGFNSFPSVQWWKWYKRTQEAIRRGVPDAQLEREPKSSS